MRGFASVTQFACLTLKEAQAYGPGELEQGVGMPREERDIRLQVMLQAQELEAIEHWRFAKHMPSRAAAIRELIRRGLQAEGFTIAPTGKASSEFGVTGKTTVTDEDQ
jgi:hypothetical protein